LSAVRRCFLPCTSSSPCMHVRSALVASPRPLQAAGGFVWSRCAAAAVATGRVPHAVLRPTGSPLTGTATGWPHLQFTTGTVRTAESSEPLPATNPSNAVRVRVDSAAQASVVAESWRGCWWTCPFRLRDDGRRSVPTARRTCSFSLPQSAPGRKQREKWQTATVPSCDCDPEALVESSFQLQRRAGDSKSSSALRSSVNSLWSYQLPPLARLILNSSNDPKQLVLRAFQPPGPASKRGRARHFAQSQRRRPARDLRLFF